MINKIKIQKKNIKNIFQIALDSNSSIQIVHDYVANLYPHENHIHVIAVGKAAPAMLEGAITALGNKFSNALLVTKINCGSEKISCYPNVQTIIAGHPIPDKQSLLAGEALVHFLQGLKKDNVVLFLISGGTSSLVEYFPQDVSTLISISDLIKLNKWLLASDKNIMEVNQIRKNISGIKAGRLLEFIKCENIISLYISDVPDDSLNNIGSGLLQVENDFGTVKKLPGWIKQLIKAAELIPKPCVNKKITSHIVFSNSDLRKTIVDVAKKSGYPNTTNKDEFIAGNTLQEAQRIGKWLKEQSHGVYVWGAETHMILPEKPGVGGRNQSFALALAKEIQNCSNIIVLLAGTDGNDGNTNDAGAIIDGFTIERGNLNGMSAELSLNEANAGAYLSATGDLLTLGETGTNVMDIIIALIWD
jgi:hydroxypyruvate reductase